MAKQHDDRLIRFIHLLMKQPRSMEELTRYFEVNSRTIYRWILKLKDEFNIEVERQNVGRFSLTDDSKERINQDSIIRWRLNTVSLMNTLDSRQALKERILLEDIPSSSNLDLILQAMEANHWINFDYIKYYNNPDLETKHYECMEPYCVKVFERRWYVICHSGEIKDNKGMRTFSLDQISNLKVMNTSFKLPEDFNAEDYFKDVYGITTGMNGELQTIKVKVDQARANYFRALPLHHTQTEEQYDGYSIFSYELRPSNDFYQVLLHHAEHVVVLEPAEVREEMAKKVRAMAEKYM